MSDNECRANHTIIAHFLYQSLKTPVRKEIIMKSRNSWNLEIPKEVSCNLIIHSAGIAAAVVSAVPIPCADGIMIAAIQTVMGAALGTVYGANIVDISKNAAATVKISSTVGKGLSRAVIGSIPVAGQIIKGGTAFAVTESAGWLLAKGLDSSTQKRKHSPPSNTGSL